MSVLRKDDTRFLETEIDREIVLMDTRTGSFLTLKDSAAAIWRLIDGTRSLDAILSSLEQNFDGPGERIAQELDAFVADLRSVGFVT